MEKINPAKKVGGLRSAFTKQKEHPRYRESSSAGVGYYGGYGEETESYNRLRIDLIIIVVALILIVIMFLVLGASVYHYDIVQVLQGPGVVSTT